jgi:hypothetical protein
MPKDILAIAAIDEAFVDLLAFFKSTAVTREDAFEQSVKEKLDKEGKTVFGYKRAMRFMMEEFVQRCGIIIWHEDATYEMEKDITGSFCTEFCKKVHRTRPPETTDCTFRAAHSAQPFCTSSNPPPRPAIHAHAACLLQEPLHRCLPRPAPARARLWSRPGA